MSDQGFRTTDPWPGGEIATLRAQLTALQATADRYREALEKAANELSSAAQWLHDLHPRYSGTAQSIQYAATEARDALADTSPPAQPAKRVIARDMDGFTPPRPLAGKVARHLEDLGEPVALHPATVEACAAAVDAEPDRANSEHFAARIRSLLSSPRGAR